MANFSINVSGLAVNYHEHIQAFHEKETNSLKSPMKTTTPSSSVMRTKIVKEFCIRNTHFTRINGTGAAIVEKQKTKQHLPSTVGSLVQDGLVYRENFMIRSFEIGFDGKISLPTLSNYLQDTALNHCNIIELRADGLGLTPEMCRKDLIWVVSTINIVMHRYLSWLDVVEVDTWMYHSGKNGLGRNWIVRNVRTGEIVAQASSVSSLMNKKTRKLSNFTKEIKDELAPHMLDNCNPIIVIDNGARKNLRFDVNAADFASLKLTPGWNDLDLNQHVNHVKYIDWVLQGIPRSLIEHHKLSAITLKYKKECNIDSILKCLTKVVKNYDTDHCIDDDSEVELDHLLLLGNGLEILRGSTLWKPRD